MKQDKQENNDERSLVECSIFGFSKSILDYCLSSTPIIIGVPGIKDDTTDYEKMNRVIYL